MPIRDRMFLSMADTGKKAAALLLMKKYRKLCMSLIYITGHTVRTASANIIVRVIAVPNCVPAPVWIRLTVANAVKRQER